MNKLIAVLILGFFSIAPTNLKSQDIPSSRRSKMAIEKIEPNLQKELVKNNLIWGAPIYIRIFKMENELEIWVKRENNFHLFKTYTICTYGSGYLGPKIQEGDSQAPEGFYYVTPVRLNPLSNFHLSFNIGYPNQYDWTHNRTGSAIMVHGSCVSIGCYAMTNDGIEEIYAMADAALRNGQRFFRVHIFPFKMTNENMENHKDLKWFYFWQNLKEGYDFFENHGNVPPNVEVKDGQYIFNESK